MNVKSEGGRVEVVCLVVSMDTPGLAIRVPVRPTGAATVWLKRLLLAHNVSSRETQRGSPRNKVSRAWRKTADTTESDREARA